jgi:hypothetical protein
MRFIAGAICGAIVGYIIGRLSNYAFIVVHEDERRVIDYCIWRRLWLIAHKLKELRKPR